MDSSKLYPRGHSEEPYIRIPNMKETGKAGGNLQRIGSPEHHSIKRECRMSPLKKIT